MDTIAWIVVLIGLMGAIGKLIDKGKSRMNSEGQTLRPAELFREADGTSSSQPVKADGSELSEEVQKAANEGPNEPYERDQYDSYSKANGSPYERETRSAYQRKARKPYRKKQSKKPNPFRHLTREQLREGIVLAEVLSEKPRAQNPHPAAPRYDNRRTKG